METAYIQIIAMLVTAGAVYGGIRSDIKAILMRITQISDEAHLANKRIDEILMKGK